MEINGKILIEIRRLTPLTQDELAERLGTTRRTVQNYESGTSIPASIQKLVRYEFPSYFSGENISHTSSLATTSPMSGACTNPECTKKISLLEAYIQDLLDDKRRLKEQVDYLQKGVIVPGKRVTGGVEEFGKTAG